MKAELWVLLVSAEKFTSFIVVLYLIFYACLCLRLVDVGTNPFPRLPVPAVHTVVYSAVMCKVCKEPYSDLAAASSQYDLLLCSETFVSDMRYMSELLVPGFSPPFLLCRGQLRGAVKCICKSWIWSIQI